MQWKVPQFMPFIGDEEYQAIGDCFAANWITEGPKSQLFLDRLQQLTGAPYAVLCPNGTLALYLALRASGVGAGDEVIVPDFTFMGSASAVHMTGATPVFCDINPRSLQVEAQHVKPLITEHTRGVMPVHIYGMACHLEPILTLAREHGFAVVEDAAQAIGVFDDGHHAGTLGDAGCFSFFADKTVTTGEGGLVVTSDEQLHRQLCLLRNQGRIERGSFIHPAMGYNFRLTDLQAAVGVVQLGKLQDIVQRKLQLLGAYREGLSGIDEVSIVEPGAHSNHVPFRIAVLARDAHPLMAHLAHAGVETRSFFYPLHRQPAFAYLAERHPAGGRDDQAFPGAMYAYEHGVCLPSFPTLPRSDVEYVCARIREFYGGG